MRLRAADPHSGECGYETRRVNSPAADPHSGECGYETRRVNSPATDPHSGECGYVRQTRILANAATRSTYEFHSESALPGDRCRLALFIGHGRVRIDAKQMGNEKSTQLFTSCEAVGMLQSCRCAACLDRSPSDCEEGMDSFSQGVAKPRPGLGDRSLTDCKKRRIFHHANFPGRRKASPWAGGSQSYRLQENAQRKAGSK